MMTDVLGRFGGLDKLSTKLACLGDGNPGAFTVLSGLVREGFPRRSFEIIEELDPKARGSWWWMVYKDVCGEDIKKTAVLVSLYAAGLLQSHRGFREVWDCSITADIPGRGKFTAKKFKIELSEDGYSITSPQPDDIVLLPIVDGAEATNA